MLALASRNWQEKTVEASQATNPAVPAAPALAVPAPAAIAFSAEHGGGLHVLDPSTGRIRKIDVGMEDIGDLAYSKARRLLAFEGAKEHEEPNSLYLLDLSTKRKERIFRPKEGKEPLYRPRFDPLGHYLYALNYSEGFEGTLFRRRLGNRYRLLACRL